MIENVVGLFSLPVGIAQNFVVNGREVMIPMVVEEPSIVAGASFMAKLARTGDGFTAKSAASEMIGQLQLLDLPDLLIEATPMTVSASMARPASRSAKP